jgi:ribosome-associated protein
MEEVKIKTPFIKLDQLLKYSGVTVLGSEAKDIIISGDVLLNGNVVTQRGKKIIPGDIVEIKNHTTIKVIGD